MAKESLSANKLILAPAEVVFAVLADPATPAAIDGTGWASEALDSEPLDAPEHVFRRKAASS